MSVEQRSLELLVSPEELQRRVATQIAPAKTPTRGYSKLYAREILQADAGCDFRFLLPQKEENKIAASTSIIPY